MITLFRANETDFTHNGLGSLDNNIVDPLVQEDLNGLYSFSFKYPIFATHGLEIEGQSLIRVPVPDGSNQLFRVYKPIKSMGYIGVNCYHIFYDLVDNFIEDTNIVAKGGMGAITQLGGATQYPNLFTFFSDISTVANARMVRMNPVTALLDDGKDNTFISRWGGELKRDNFSVRMMNAIGTNRGVSIRHKKDLLGYEAELDWSTPVTRIMPEGYNGLFLPEKYVDSPLIASYVYPKIQMIKYDDIKASIGEDEGKEDAVPLEDAYTMMRERAAQEYSVNKVDIPQATYKIEFIPLAQTKEYANYQALENILIGDTITVTHEEDGLNIEAKMIKYSYDPLIKKYKSIELGNFKDRFTNIQRKLEDTLNEVSEVIADNKSSLQDAIDNATELLTTALGGYVVKRNGELLIMDTEDPMTATKVWRWNLNGLGYSSTGINGPYPLAMTMDGRIVANFITTGVLTSILIQSDNYEDGVSGMEINLNDGTINTHNFNVDAQGNVMMNDAVMSNADISGIFIQRDVNGHKAIEIKNNGLRIYDYTRVDDLVGGITSTITTSNGRGGTTVYGDIGNPLFLSWKSSEDLFTRYMSFDDQMVEGSKYARISSEQDIGMLNYRALIYHATDPNRVEAKTWSGSLGLWNVVRNKFYIADCTENDGSGGSAYVEISRSLFQSWAPLYVLGESKFLDTGYVDPWEGTACAVKVSGRVGIGDSLMVGGTVHYDSLSQNSERRVKKDISDLDVNALQIIKGIQVYKFRYKKEDEFAPLKFGSMFEEVPYEYQVVGKYVNVEEPSGIDITKIVWTTVKAIQELSKNVEDYTHELQEEINELYNKNAELTAKLESFEDRLLSLENYIKR